jgi:hypothetical protein
MPGIFNSRAADIILILAAPTPWSTTIMTDNPKTCVDPYLESFAQSFAAANYTAGTIRTSRASWGGLWTPPGQFAGEITRSPRLAGQALKDDHPQWMAEQRERAQHFAKYARMAWLLGIAQVSAQNDTFGKSG